MHAAHGQGPHAIPHVLVDPFREPSLRETLLLVWHGLRQPRGSGEHAYARRQTLRLLSPLSGVVLPGLLLLLVTQLSMSPEPIEDSAGISIGRTLEPAPPLDDRDPLPPPPPPAALPARWADPLGDGAPGLAVAGPVGAGNDSVAGPPGPSLASGLPGPEALLGVIRVPSPIRVRGIWEGRTPGGIEAGTRRHNAPAGTEVAVYRALRWLQSVQQPDGAWREPAPAMTGLALLCFLAHGETPNSAEFGSTVEAGLKWLVANQERDGHFRERDAHDYSQPIAAYALSEAFGLTRNPTLAEAVQRAVQVIVAGQHPTGAWDYNCLQTARDDTSYSGWCVQALKAAHIARADVEGLGAALARSAQGMCRQAAPAGGFGYTGPGAGGLTGVGVLCLQLAGQAAVPESRRGLVWLDQATCAWRTPWGPRPLYYWYYATQAKFHAGGRTWEAWNRQFAGELMAHQVVLRGAAPGGGDLGYWDAPAASESYGTVYSTALCTLMLEVYYRTLLTMQPDPPPPAVDLSGLPGEVPIEFL